MGGKNLDMTWDNALGILGAAALYFMMNVVICQTYAKNKKEMVLGFFFGIFLLYSFWTALAMHNVLPKKIQKIIGEKPNFKIGRT